MRVVLGFYGRPTSFLLRRSWNVFGLHKVVLSFWVFFLNMFIYLIFKSRTPVLGYFQLNLNFASRHHGRPRAAPGAPRMRMCENHSTVHREHGKGNECLLPSLLDT